jgi:cell division septation protein DedD
MELTLKQPEIETAIQNHVRKLFTNTEGFVFNVDLRAGRGVDGFTATVDISDAGTPAPPKTVVPKPVPRNVEPVVEEIDAPDTPTDTTTTEASPEDNKSEQPEAAAAVEAQEETPTAATTGRRPLFSKLNKPATE